MIDWELIRYATNTDNKPTPGYAFNDLITNIRENPQGVPDVAAYLAECVSAPILNNNAPTVASTALHGAADYVGDAIYDVVLDYREKGAVGTLRDATLDAADLVADGLEAAATWMRDMLAGSTPPPSTTTRPGGGANITLPPNLAICDNQPITSTGGFLEQYRQQNGSQFASVLEQRANNDASPSSSSSSSSYSNGYPRVIGPGIDIMVDGKGAATVISVDRTLNPPVIVVRLASDGSRIVVDEDKCHLEDTGGNSHHTEDLLDVGGEDGIDIGDGYKAVPMVGSTPASKIANDDNSDNEVNTPPPPPPPPSAGNDDLLGLQDTPELFQDPGLAKSLKKAEANI
ncbi:hypothetical protein FOL47_009754 [Perkinsus chesapeaki]|uniref:Uncharacterized protein n=1 Tax=Perkinsus chesapeaki TaxID=330153 RepID=A0A7J6MR82_PERCH|nr:hypothetical protein FOL47_009754 [Perkinsus chesapeaki]